MVKGFTSRYAVHRLVYYAYFEEMSIAIAREKQIKAGSRKAKIQLIEQTNPNWDDLYIEIVR